ADHLHQDVMRIDAKLSAQPQWLSQSRYRVKEREAAATDWPAVDPQRSIPRAGDYNETFETIERGGLADRAVADCNINPQPFPWPRPVPRTCRSSRCSGRARDERRPVDGRCGSVPAHWRLGERPRLLGPRLLRRVWWAWWAWRARLGNSHGLRA